MKICPETLKRYRTQIPMSQDDLAAAARVSKKTIARIETGQVSPNATTIARLAAALKVSAENLGKTLKELDDSDVDLSKAGLRQVKIYIGGEVALAFQMVEDVYGISVSDQIDMAPLFTALLAEGSLAWRREQLAAIDEAADRLMTLGGGHLSFANAAYRVQDAASEEGLSISIRDLFGRQVASDNFELGYNTSKNNPFADYLRAYANQVEAKNIHFDPNDNDQLNDAGLPEYRIAAARIQDLTSGDSMAEFALLRGHAAVRDIPKDLLGEKAREQRVAWLISQIPAEVRKGREDELEHFARLFRGLTDEIILDKREDDDAPQP